MTQSNLPKIWTVEIEDDQKFRAFYRSLKPIEQATLMAGLQEVLPRLGMNICNTEWGKALGGSLYEFRIRRSLDAIYREFVSEEAVRSTPSHLRGREVSLRVFCTFEGNKIALVLDGYDKQKDPSAKTQNRMIAKARRSLASHKTEQKQQLRQKKSDGNTSVSAPKRHRKKRR